MPQPQKGICAEPNLHALYLMFNVIDEQDDIIRSKLAQILNIFEHYDEEHYEAMISGVVAVGTNYWMELYPGGIPKELAPFPDMHCDDRHAPVVPSDLFIQIRADRADICHAIGVDVYELLKGHVELLEQVKGFRYLDGRDLTGFVDGTENPKGMHKLDVAIVGDEDPSYTGGSYIHIQRYRHNLDNWNQVPVEKQEQIMGRTKSDDVEFLSHKKARYAHTKRTSLKDDDGNSIEILRQSMPYGNMKVQGLFFVSCAKSSRPFTQMLESMIFGDETGTYDKILDFTTAETGAAYFAPSIDFIRKQGDMS
ncbi:MAG: Dyp-type peroxidase [Alteromonadaceae bacterium]|nr:Dyp-type peroxidase [Alteromonadaceae bacterium]